MPRRDTTLTQRHYVATYAVSTAVGNAMASYYSSRYDRHDIHILLNRETKGNNQSENKNIERRSTLEVNPIFSEVPH